MQTKPILSMRTYFAKAGSDPVDATTFATGIFATLQAQVRSQLARVGFAPAENVRLLDVKLGDPTKPVDAPVRAYVNANAWLAKCECGGAEFVDLVSLRFMCCSCWNERHGHAWRVVVMPSEREAIERALLVRPERARNWRVDEDVAFLQAENTLHELPREAEVA